MAADIHEGRGLQRGPFILVRCDDPDCAECRSPLARAMERRADYVGNGDPTEARYLLMAAVAPWTQGARDERAARREHQEAGCYGQRRAASR